MEENKNILLALASIIAGFIISFFTLNAVFNNNSSDKATNETVQTEEVKKDNNETTATTEKNNTEEPVEVESSTSDDTDSKNINTDDIQESFENWNAYTKENIDLMSTFIPKDQEDVIMDKRIFLVSLRTGAFIPVKSKNKKGEIQYRLTPIKEGEEKIKKSIVSKATVAYQYYKMEGKKLPKYNFVDLEGKSHNKADTEGKLLVLKCWFITCKVCVEEFPQLNDLVDKYKDDNIEFVSLAFDEKDKLIEFLKTKEFKYPTIPNHKEYMTKKLKVKQYPTHLIVDENGVILKMVNNVKTLTRELELVVGR